MAGELKNIRWHQRFQNLERVFGQLHQGLTIKNPSDLEILGIIRVFESALELSWKTVKDYLESQGVVCRLPSSGGVSHQEKGFTYPADLCRVY